MSKLSLFRLYFCFEVAQINHRMQGFLQLQEVQLLFANNLAKMEGTLRWLKSMRLMFFQKSVNRKDFFLVRFSSFCDDLELLWRLLGCSDRQLGGFLHHQAKPTLLGNKVTIDEDDFDMIVTAGKKFATQEKKESTLQKSLEKIIKIFQFYL